PPWRTMTMECASSFSRHDLPESFNLVAPPGREGAGNAGCTLHPRSRVPRTRAIGAHEHTGERKHSGIPLLAKLDFWRSRFASGRDPARADLDRIRRLARLAQHCHFGKAD